MGWTTFRGPALPVGGLQTPCCGSEASKGTQKDYWVPADHECSTYPEGSPRAFCPGKRDFLRGFARQKRPHTGRSMSRQVIRLHPAAPAKPAESAPCNGCGVCCAAEPCPIGVLVSGRRSGACAALAWSEAAQLYRCALVTDPSATLPWLPVALAPLLSRLARRWISAASGCDSSLVVEG